MANFSAGSGYMPLYAIFGAVVSFPATLLLWAGMAVSITKGDGTADYPVIKRRLNRVLLPLCGALYICCVFLFAAAIYGSIVVYAAPILWGAAVPTLGIYGSVFCSATILNAKGKLTKGKWFLLTMLLSALIAIAGTVITFLLANLCDSLPI
ncbi:MAG: hypothetical protein FWG03_10940 [Clostridiales bacterium]|nr:hypothetical protein [Clostridiales bacterium]